MTWLGISAAVVVVVLVVWFLAQTRYKASSAAKDFRIAAREGSDEELASSVVEPIWFLPTGSVAATKLPRKWENVTDGQILVYAVTWLEREVNNGGFWQYFYNSPANLPATALDGLKKIGATDFVKLLEEALTVFPDGVLPGTRKDRLAILPQNPYVDDLPAHHRTMVATLHALDDRFYELYGDGEQYYKLMADYIRAHPVEFFR